MVSMCSGRPGALSNAMPMLFLICGRFFFVEVDTVVAFCCAKRL